MNNTDKWTEFYNPKTQADIEKFNRSCKMSLLIAAVVAIALLLFK